MALFATGLSTQVYNNHIKSVLLLAGFPLLLLLMLWAFCGGLDVLMHYAAHSSPDWARAARAGTAGVRSYGHWAFAGAAAWFAVAFFFHGRILRMATGAVPVTRAQMPRLYNLLENLCIARGLAMPRFEIIDSPALNAFASGIGEKSYRIVLTRGIVDCLSDDELEAVIAHELTHITNRDVRLLMVAVIFTGMISFFAHMLFRGLLHGRRPNPYARRGDRRGGGAMIVLLALAVLAVGWLFAIVIRFSLSRRREYLADAGAVALTKNPEAMMRALLRISGRDRVGGMPGEVAQMCIENSAGFTGLFATHPPIDARIRAISEATRTPVPALPVTLRRPPKRPWDAPGETV